MKRKNADPAPAARIPRKNADPAPAARIPRHDESAPHQNHGPCSNDQPVDIQSATASLDMATASLDMASSASKISSFEANSAGLTQARATKSTTAAVERRRVQFLDHLLKQASGGQQVPVRSLNKRFGRLLVRLLTAWALGSSVRCCRKPAAMLLESST